MLKLGISQRLLTLLFTTALIPYMAISSFWYASAQSKLRSDAVQQQALTTERAADTISQYLTDTVNALQLQAQALSIQNPSKQASQTILGNMLKENQDISSAILADTNGNETLAMDQTGLIAGGKNISATDGFRAATFLNGKAYISQVSRDIHNQPFITISIPVTSIDSQTNRGVLVATVSLERLWHSVLDKQQGNENYAFIVDSHGNLLGYPDASFASSHQNLSKSPPVAAFLDNPSAAPSGIVIDSERGGKVMSSHTQIARTGWGVITEASINDIFGSANHTAIIGTWVFVIVAAATIIMTYLFSRQLIVPIRKLIEGARRLSSGDLATRINTKSADEIGVLSTAFNSMADSMETNMRNMRAETSKVSVILNNISEGIVAIDGDGKIIIANIAASVFIGAVPRDVIGRPVGEMYKWSLNGKPLDINPKEIHVYNEVTLTNADRRERFVNLLVNPIASDPTGIKAILTIIDKTSERDLEHMKVDFVSMAAHELRTPMTAIRGYLDLIWHDKDLSLPENTQNYLQHIQSSSTQLIGLINNLLNVSRIERGALTLKKDKLDVAKLIEACISDQQFLAKTKSISLSYQGASEDVFIFADQLAFGEVINNLVSNAIHYTLENGHVMVKMREDGDHIVISVSDDGVGIDQEGLEHLFTKFYRVRNNLTNSSGGTGLGLFISKSIVELHKGTISVESKPNVGTVFTITLPKFNQAEYNEVVNSRSITLSAKHGWFTKNITRRR